MKIKFDVSRQELATIQQILQQHLPARAKVWVFGSRAKQQAKYNSDLDLAIEAPQALTDQVRMQLEEAFDDAPLAYKVDIVDIHTASTDFVHIINQQKQVFPIKSNVPELRFSEFDGEWELGVARDLIGALEAGVSVNSGDEPALKSQKGILKTSCVSSGRFNFNENKVVYDVNELCRLKQPVEKESIIISRMNTPTLVGANAYITEDHKNLFLPDRLWAAKINSKHMPAWVGTLTASPKFRNSLTARATGTSSSMKNITKDDVYSLPVFYPSKREQQQIAEFLTSVDNKLDLLQQKLDRLTDYKKGTMQKIFAQQVRFKQDDGSLFPDWQEKAISEVLQLQAREVIKPEAPYLALGIRSHMKGTFQKPNSDPEAIAIEKLYVVKANDLVVNITFAWEGAVAIAKECDEGGLVSHRFPTYTFKDGQATHKYFQHIIKQERFKYLLGTISPGGAGRNRVLSKSEFSKLKLLLPSVQEQQKISEFLSAIDVKISKVEQQIEQTQAFKQGLLQKMFV